MITQFQQQQVISETQRTILRAAEYYNIKLPSIPVLFDLSGRAAGMYRVRGSQRVIRYNPAIFALYFDDNLANTVVHEVAHYVTDSLYGLRKIKPHGKEWKHAMQALGAAPEVTCRYDLGGLQLRRQQRYPYQCDCTRHALSSVRHNRINLGKARYHCRQCGSMLRPWLANAA